jgi:two-component system cell cycle sensor histidine kinase/response regulator CckA
MNSEAKKSRSSRLLKVVAAHAGELETELSQLYRKSAFDNRYTLHPRRLKELGPETIELFRRFLDSNDSRSVRLEGQKRALEGLHQRPLLETGAVLRRFLVQSLPSADRQLLPSLIQTIDVFMTSLIDGYVDTREVQILGDQQQLRVALSTALDRQRRELHIKNHAIHTSINGIVLCELNGRMTYVNPATLRMWGHSNERDLIGRSCAELFDSDGSYILDRTRERGSWQGELTVTRKDGRPFEVAVSASVILDESNDPTGIMAFFYDVTERKRLEGQFRQAQKMDALGQLAGGIVHDFNNLLAAISGYTQLALMDVPKDSKLYQDFLQIKTATDRGKELTQELRLFTRQTSSKREILNPNLVVDETYKLLLRTFPPEVKINLSLDPEVQWIRANPSQMSQVLMNLCMNARDAILTRFEPADPKATSARSRGELTLRTYNVDLEWHTAALYLNARPGRYVCITVEDTGMGIPAEFMDRLFEPFFTTKGESGGTGLGLAVVYGIVQNHDGFIDVQSREAMGSIFTVYLPAQKQTEEEVPAEEYVPDLTAGKGSVLVVEDNPQVQGMMIRALEESGYRVFSAKNGVDAITLYKKHGKLLDLVVLDMVMPQMGGRECFYRLKKINPAVKVLIITGFTTDGSLEDFLEEGARGIMTKPFELQAFTQNVQRIIKEK